MNQASRTTASAHRSSTRGTTGPGGTAVFAGTVLLIAGTLGVLQGIAAIANDDVFAEVGDYVFEVDLTGWGWLHLVLGALVAFTGYGVVQGASWARYTAIVLVALHLVANFLWLPYYPVWAIVMIGIDLVVLWALSIWTPESRLAP
ncbi:MULTISPECIES: DUF7144 family membrane protein [Streptomyces]|uniref:DUF7144 domain-containing protein n=2 Tax=Streptomyces TaxID=1883 RepID=A0A3M8F4V4_9ACTN|nr:MULTISPECIES: hypothetical protein [Streptomyces]KNE79720.1 membrane protein [Streptomyces fradiae]OFA37812.1 hypothetical protein BEN35_28325 [Streptomyces fradiae]PQM21077.1 hypothetical protein Sfr7A_23925 [Streptomyces xinghaiensis]RKM92930.1 hypothetical protein SFRA_023870 [Streptomyces xinghaiensis]RNC72518.1 hypothetical protein DC095_019360 [Streptomyces xinghaiensis]